jgi:anaerobic selenocysteine-containing dehydrogenase
MMAEAFDWSAPAMAGITLESLRQSGWARLSLPPADQYAPHAEGNFPTPSGKVEFRSSIAEQAGNFVLPLFRQGSEEYQPGGAVDPLPHYVPPRETADAGYRLNLISPKSHAYLNSSAGDPAGLAAAVYASSEGLRPWWSRTRPSAGRRGPAR